MITVRGTLEELRQQQPEIDPDAWIRAVVTDPARAGLADDVRDLLGERCVDVMAPRVDRSTSHAPSVDPTKAPSELFAEYLASQKLEDPRIAELFSELYEGLLDEISVGG
jgi:exonuclease SbcD